MKNIVNLSVGLMYEFFVPAALTVSRNGFHKSKRGKPNRL